MGEIKSTLDLIMERTKNLSMSPEEKEEMKRQEWLKKARGWIQKFLDDQVDLPKLKMELVEKDPPDGWKTLLRQELIEGLDPQGDNQKRWHLMNRLLTISLEPFLNVLSSFNHKVNESRKAQESLFLNELSSQGLTGSAVIPNLDSHPSWKAFLNQESQSCRDRWRVLRDN
jgi:hypothetical protein